MARKINPGDIFTDMNGVKLIAEAEREKDSCIGCFYRDTNCTVTRGEDGAVGCSANRIIFVEACTNFRRQAAEIERLQDLIAAAAEENTALRDLHVKRCIEQCRHEPAGSCDDCPWRKGLLGV